MLTGIAAAVAIQYLLIGWIIWRMWPRQLPVSLSVASHPEPQASVHCPPGFKGAEAPNRYLVIYWPTGRVGYAGCLGGLARQVYEHAHPATGEAVEFWDQAVCRGHKEA